MGAEKSKPNQSLFNQQDDIFGIREQNIDKNADVDQPVQTHPLYLPQLQNSNETIYEVVQEGMPGPSSLATTVTASMRQKSYGKRLSTNYKPDTHHI